MKKRLIAIGMALALVFAVGFVLNSVYRDGSRAEADPEKRLALLKEIEELQPTAQTFERLFEKVAEYVKPSVVYIRSTREVKVIQPRMPDSFRNPFFNDRGFNDRRGEQPRYKTYKRQALGSGFIVDAKGYILTNNHVVKDASKLMVKLSDNREYPAKLMGADPRMDVAVIKITSKVKGLPFVKLGDSDSTRIGQWVIAIGNPFGLNLTVSAGIISAKSRTGIGIAEYENLLQTDAAINQGNSGGPLVNLKGEVIGINTAIASTTGGFQGIGFAIPSNMVKRVLDDLIAGRKVVRGFLGIIGQDMQAEFAKQFNFKGRGGALVNEVMEDSAAGKAGFKPNDIIVQWGDKKIKDFNSLRNEVAMTKPGTVVKAKVWRGDKYITLPVKPKEKTEEVAVGPGADWLQLEVRTLTPEFAERLGKKGMTGVIVAAIGPDSPAARAVMQGDVILSVNRQPVKNVNEYNRLIAKTKPAKGALLRVYSGRTGYTRYVFVRK